MSQVTRVYFVKHSVPVMYIVYNMMVFGIHLWGHFLMAIQFYSS